MFNKYFNEYINSSIKILFRMREYFKGNSSKKKTLIILFNSHFALYSANGLILLSSEIHPCFLKKSKSILMK